MQFTRTKAVIAPQLKMADEVSYFVKPTAPIYSGKDLGKLNADGQKEKPADLMKVVDLSDNQEKVIIVGSVLKGTLQESYPNDAYVGVNLEIITHAKASGKRYKTCSLFEVSAGEGDTKAKK